MKVAWGHFKFTTVLPMLEQCLEYNRGLVLQNMSLFRFPDRGLLLERISSASLVSSKFCSLQDSRIVPFFSYLHGMPGKKNKETLKRI